MLKKKNALIHGTEEMFHIYLCYVARGTRATRLEDRGWVTIDDLWTIAERVWWLNGRATRRDWCTDVEYSRVQFRRISRITASGLRLYYGRM